MKILITGGSGFIGTWITRRALASGLEVRVLDVAVNHALAHEILGADADGVEWRTGDVSDGAQVDDAVRGCDLVIHLAAVLTPACKANPGRGAEINVIGTLNVFEAARAHGIAKVLYMSSAGVFGPEDGVVPCPTTLYGAFKLAGEGCARAYWVDYGIASVGFRPLVVYGPGREVGLTAGPTLACRAAALDEPYVIPFGGESDFVWVDDVAAAFEAAAGRTLEGAHVFNVVGETTSVTHFAQAIRKFVPGADISVQGPGVPVCAHIAEGELRTMFPEVPRTAIDVGVERTISHYRSMR
jgi:nucleoside-diphosphate-sugar epimerase